MELKEYLSPTVMVVEIKFEGMVCTSVTKSDQIEIERGTYYNDFE